MKLVCAMVAVGIFLAWVTFLCFFNDVSRQIFIGRFHTECCPPDSQVVNMTDAVCLAWTHLKPFEARCRIMYAAMVRWEFRLIFWQYVIFGADCLFLLVSWIMMGS